VRQLPQVFSQRDPRWAGVELGTAPGVTIGGYGCYLTSFAMIAGYYGHQVTPPQLNQVFVQKQDFVNQDLLRDDDLSQAFADCAYLGSRDYGAVPADLAYLQQALSAPERSVALELDFDHNPADGIQTHFVVALDCDGTNVTIADPWYGTVDAFATHYGNDPATTIQKMVIYSGSPAQGQPAPPAPSGGAQGPAQDLLQRLALDPQTVATSDDALKPYLEQLGVAVNMDTALIQRACLAYRRGETRGPAVSGEYPATAPDGRAVVRQRFSAGIAEYDPATGQVSWVEVVSHPESLPST
jgi:Papain-like cysteine protease AvrRpt2